MEKRTSRRADNRKARGYGTGHQKLRASWQRRMQSGEEVLCARCKQPIELVTGPKGQKVPERWHLGHADHRNADGSRDYIGPEHARCSQLAAAKLNKRRHAVRKLVDAELDFDHPRFVGADLSAHSRRWEAIESYAWDDAPLAIRRRYAERRGIGLPE